MGVRSQLSWLVKGRAATQSTLAVTHHRPAGAAAQGRGIDDCNSLSKELPLLATRQLDEFDKVRTAVAGATDDLMARVDALRQQVEKP